jgi:hypothetical protein
MRFLPPYQSRTGDGRSIENPAVQLIQREASVLSQWFILNRPVDAAVKPRLT